LIECFDYVKINLLTDEQFKHFLISDWGSCCLMPLKDFFCWTNYYSLSFCVVTRIFEQYSSCSFHFPLLMNWIMLQLGLTCITFDN
jgi:hypothetical protein